MMDLFKPDIGLNVDEATLQLHFGLLGFFIWPNIGLNNPKFFKTVVSHVVRYV